MAVTNSLQHHIEQEVRRRAARLQKQIHDDTLQAPQSRKLVQALIDDLQASMDELQRNIAGMKYVLESAESRHTNPSSQLGPVSSSLREDKTFRQHESDVSTLVSKSSDANHEKSDIEHEDDKSTPTQGRRARYQQFGLDLASDHWYAKSHKATAVVALDTESRCYPEKSKPSMKAYGQHVGRLVCWKDNVCSA